MGFGVLFIGYFLFLNIATYFYTDVIAATVTMLALHKLSGINRPFKIAMWLSLGFSVFACAEFAIEIISTYFFMPSEDMIHSTVAVVRYGIMLALNVLMLTGMKEVSDEVLNRLAAIGGDELCPPADLVTAERVRAWHAEGFTVRAWGVNRENMKQVFDAHADGCTVNFPDELLAYINEQNPAQA